MDKGDLKEITDRLDKLIAQGERSAKPPSLARRIVDGLATGAGILGILGAIEVVRLWVTGG